MQCERRQARKAVLQSLYALSLEGGTLDHVKGVVLKQRLPESLVAADFGVKLLERAVEMERAADELVVEHTQNWALKRMALMDRLLMRMAVTEFLCFEDIPPKVSMNEALELAKEFSTEPSSQFINGVLDSVVYSLRKSGRMRKSKAGMIGMGALKQRQDAKRSG